MKKTTAVSLDEGVIEYAQFRAQEEGRSFSGMVNFIIMEDEKRRAGENQDRQEELQAVPEKS